MEFHTKIAALKCFFNFFLGIKNCGDIGPFVGKLSHEHISNIYKEREKKFKMFFKHRDALNIKAVMT